MALAHLSEKLQAAPAISESEKEYMEQYINNIRYNIPEEKITYFIQDAQCPFKLFYIEKSLRIMCDYSYMNENQIKYCLQANFTPEETGIPLEVGCYYDNKPQRT